MSCVPMLIYASFMNQQRKEIQDIIEALPQTAGNPGVHGPRRLLRWQQDHQSAAQISPPPLDAACQNSPPASGQNAGAGPGVEMEQGDDSEEAYGRLDASDVLGKLGKDWPAKLLAASKWQTKKEMLDNLVALSSAPRLLAADYTEVGVRRPFVGLLAPSPSRDNP